MNENKKDFDIDKIREYKEKGYLFHGSDISGIKSIKPNRAGYDRKHVYATSDFASSIIFSAKRINTLIIEMKRKKDGTISVCERLDGIFSKLFKGVGSSIYVLDGKDFIIKKGCGLMNLYLIRRLLF